MPSEIPKEPYIPQRGIPRYPISQDDLEELERILPELYSFCMQHFTQPRQRKQWGRVKEILSNVRWDYGPMTECYVIPASEFDNGEEGNEGPEQPTGPEEG